MAITAAAIGLGWWFTRPKAVVVRTVAVRETASEETGPSSTPPVM